ncbi:hypothetical protein GpartN1_g2316.t1 [Galdieria partita]|uniref:Apoptosis-antagonizing transcription factor C-terminal domain-containing protein n=1 Tax=Galdieria partita TaxID=83374 RepID=A0A9C7UPH5_9RHOD|nr:hypothetical protein GpartN1_g2316.t1 [Galdieria partita]
MRNHKEHKFSKTEEHNNANLDPEDEVKDQWDNELLNTNSYYSVRDSKRRTEHPERETKVPKRLRLRPTITVQGSKYQGKVIDRKSLNEESNSSVATDDREDKDSFFEFEEKLESYQDSVDSPVKQQLLNDSQGFLRLSSETQEQVSKGRAIIEQKSMFDSILKLRISMQRLLTIANCFPDERGRSFLKQMDLLGTEKKFSETTQSIYKMITAMMHIQEVLFMNSSILALNEEEDSFSGEDDWTLRASEDLYASADISKEVDRLWSKLKKRNLQLNSLQEKVLDYWDRKVREATGKMYDQTSKFKVINQTVLNQIQGVLSNRQRLVRRAHTRRDSNRPLFCLLSSENNDIEPEIYDDGDFYQLLLKEAVNDSKGEGINNVSQLKRNRRRKQYFDRRESKGRRLKYTVHDKLVGFLAPIPMEQSETRNQLLKSLFGGE